MDLSEFEAKPHPVKARLYAHGVKCSTISRYIGRAYTTTCSMLSGVLPMPAEVESKLLALAGELDRESKAQARRARVKAVK